MTTNRTVILSGFKEDCEKLITRFEQANDIRFQTFCEIWRDVKFSLVFSGRQTILELLEFCEESLHICKQFLFLPPRFKERIGGLYLLYGVYYKMPIDQFKIRIKLEDWKNIMELHAEIKESEHLDANYILCKLIADNAFHFCIFDREFGLEKHFRVKERQCFNPFSVLPAMKDMTEEQQMLSKINALNKIYAEKKSIIASHKKTNASLNLYKTEVAEEIINDIREFEEQRRNRQKKDSAEQRKLAGASTSKEQGSKTSEPRYKRKARAKRRDGFDTDSCESEEDSVDMEDYDPNLPEDFD